MDSFKIKLDKTIAKYLPRVKELRHKIHSNPELGNEEFATSSLVKEEMSKLNLEVLPQLLKTDVVCLLNSDKKGKNILLRADMDALPIKEESHCAYQSKNKGVMHACGHDGHTAILMGTAMVLSELKEHLNGSIKFVFQPAEEGLSGGKDLVDAGVLQNPKSDVAFALHGYPNLKEGTISTRKGVVTSAISTFKLKIIGKGGHSSTPEHAIDAIIGLVKIIEALKQIPSECFSFLDSVLISVCKIEAGTAINIIPNDAFLEGSVRYFDAKNDPIIKAKMENVIRGICSIYGANYEFEYVQKYISSVNNDEVVNFSENIIKEYFNVGQWLYKQDPLRASEDFSFFLEQCPGALFFIGLGNQSGNLHTSSFDFNDNVIADGIKLFCSLTYEYLLK